MKRKDDLLRLAFGELTDEAARAVEARAGEAELVEVESFRRLHDDLRHLPPPPPDNLTAERLRAAILDRELTARRPFAWGLALFAPVALAAFAAVLMLPRLQPRPAPQIVSLGDAESQERRAFSVAPFASFRSLAPVASLNARSRIAPTMAMPHETLSDAQEVGEPRMHRRRVRHSHVAPLVEEPQMKTDGLLAFNPSSEGSETPSGSTNPPASQEPQTIVAPPSTVVEAAPGSTGKMETVVIVSSKRDLETGAPAATEKEATSVLVGG